jgi:uncharacterized protein (TIGR02145 family)
MKNLLFLAAFFFTAFLFAQNPFNGVTFPSLSNEERDKLTDVKNGFTIYNSSTKCLNYFSEGDWLAICGQCASPPSAPKLLEVKSFYNSIALTFAKDKYTRKLLLMPNYTLVQDTGARNVIVRKEGTPLNGVTLINTNDCGSSEPILAENINFATQDPCGGLKTIKDERNGKIYEVYAIGNQCWMSQNLHFGVADNKKTFEDKGINASFYTWDFGKVSKNAKTGEFESVPQNNVCPAGWHIPNKNDAVELVDFYHNYGSVELMRKGFNFDTDTYLYDPEKKIFENQGDRLLFWTTAVSPVDDGRGAFFISEADVVVMYIPKEAGLNIRCVKDSK